MLVDHVFIGEGEKHALLLIAFISSRATMCKRWSHHLLIVLFFWTCIVSQQTMDTFPLKFTHSLYKTTIYENSAAKTFVECPVKMGIFIQDQSWDIWYRIEEGDHEKLFKAEKYILGDFSFLRIRTKGGSSATLNREVKDRYLLTVHAIERNSGAEAQTQVEVQVLDANDLRPLFSPTSYTISVPDSTPIKTSIGRVSATDADTGTNGEFYFSFKEWTAMFSIHPTSGVITLTGKLDYLEMPRYEIDVLAVDRGLKLYGRSDVSSTAKLTVEVLQSNDHAPVVKAVPLTPQNTTMDPTYALVSVEDYDEGQNGETASLSIVAGDPLQQFKAIRTSPGSNEYKIKANKEVTWEGYDFGYNLTLQAEDKGNPSKFSSAVIVRIKPPYEKTQFEKSIYRVTLSEFAPPHSPVVMVRGVPKHPDLKYLLQYKMQQHRNPFAINPNTGLITTVEPVQAERVSQYEFDVTASDRQASTKVVVNIIDMNNNAPKFQQPTYEASIDEHVPIGTSILAVSASDDDEGENGYVTYSIVSMNKKPFAIDYFTGVISTSEELDYEKMPSKFYLRVRASDWGSPFRREAEAVVVITLNNLNDNAPLFEYIDCGVTLPRSFGVGKQIIVVSAIDADDLGIVRYHISAGNENDIFELDPTSGVLTLKKSLIDGDDKNQHFHALQIEASDGEISSSAMHLNITVVNSLKEVRSRCVETEALRRLAEMLLFGSKLHTETEMMGDFADMHSVNNSAPQFVESIPHQIGVKEDFPVGSSVVLLKAIDADNGFNGKLLYVISGGNVDSCFMMETDTGWLKVLEPLDRETTDHYTLNITVYDLGLPQKSASHILEINVLDVNDNRPEFLENEYSVDVGEDSTVGTDIIQLEATDKDLGINGEVIYSFLTKTDKFTINEETGIVTVRSPLDREANPSFALRVAAYDKAPLEHRLISTVILNIMVEDVNDNAPTFSPSYYHVRVREDIPVGTLIFWLEAHDPDLGQSGQVRYSLTDAADGSFQVDKVSGAVYLSQALDFERKQAYNLTAKAKDRGKPIPLSSACFIEVEIVDVNENLYRPSFPFFVDWGSVSEDAPVGSFVMKVIANDEDEGRDGEICYAIHGGSGIGVFTIDEVTGVIRTQEILDRETTSHYWLTIYATDQGVVPLSSSVEVYIDVQDVNDNAPQTSEPVYYSSLLENSPKDVSIMQIQAFDPDSKASDKLTYKITSGNPQGFFNIDSQTGLMTTTSRKLDREKQDEHVLEVTISDDGVPTLSTVVRVVVKVEDENDNAPQFLEKVYKIKLVERPRTVRWEPVYRVIAHDKDESPYSEISYSIEEGDEARKFFIEPKTGLISSKEAFSAGDYHILTIKALDNGRPQKSSICRLHIEWIAKPEPAKEALVFEETSLQFSAVESDPVGHMVGVISTQPLDSPVWFDIKGGNDDSRYNVEKGSGTLIIAKALDAEQQLNYNLTVEATDGTRFVSTQVLIQVIDTNEHRPKFGQAKYEISIPEETQPGMKILEISATDKDEKNKLFYTLLSSTDPHSLKKFRLDPGTGFLYTTEELDHETMHRHTLTVMVRDQDVPVKQNLVRVIISVEDGNDNAPRFTSSQYTGRVFETAAIGSAVLQVTALDKDKGQNAEILYSIVSGNHGNSFTIDPLLGIIKVAEELSSDQRSQYELKFHHSSITARISETAPVGTFVTMVSASSTNMAGMASQVTVIVHIMDENDNAPVFSQSEFVGLVYQIVEPFAHNYFAIDSGTGSIQTISGLDYEQRSAFHFTVQAHDTGLPRLFTRHLANVTVHVTDVNDCAPRFSWDSFETTLLVPTYKGVKVISLNATDDDSPPNAKLLFSILDGNIGNKFRIDHVSGEIFVLNAMQLRSRYILTVRVSDGRFTSTATVKIKVRDNKDPGLKFTQEVFSASVQENSSRRETLAIISTVGNEINKPLFYSILNPDERFDIGRTSGVLFTTGVPFDREDQDAFDVIVEVTKQQKDAGTAHVLVKVLIEDVNDNAPLFVDLPYNSVAQMDAEVGTVLRQINPTGEISLKRAFGQESLNTRYVLNIIAEDGEDVQLHTSVLQVLANESVGPRTVYRIYEGDPFGHFSIDFNTGVIEVIQPLDYETHPAHSVPESTMVGTSVLQVSARDSDTGNKEIFYQLYTKTGSISDHFRIDGQSGVIWTTALLDYEAEPKHELTVKALDGGASQLHTYDVDGTDTGKLEFSFLSGNEDNMFNIDKSTFAEVKVEVISANQHSPSFTQDEYIVELLENSAVGTFVTQVEVYDKDPGIYGEVTLLIVNDAARDKFTLNADGQIYAAESFDRENPTEKFRLSEYKAAVQRDVPSGTTVIKISAVDEDEGSNADIVYAIDSDIGHFEIHPLNGAIVTQGSLMELENGLYSFYVTAKDSGSPPRQSVIPVSIKVLPSDLPMLKFAEGLLQLELAEDLPVGTEINVIQSERKRPVIYSLVRGNTPESNKDDVFVINSNTGKLKLAKRLDYEAIKWFQLSIQVQGTEEGMEVISVIDVNIHLKDVNDNSPQFDSLPYQSFLVENLPGGTSVVQVRATDLDSGENGQVTYSLDDSQESPEVLELFTVDSETGWITTITEIDREKRNRYRIAVIAKDKAPEMHRTGSTMVEVTVVDLNDNPPVFTKAVFKATVREDESTPGTIIAVLRTTDSDSEEVNRRFSCFITGGDPRGQFNLKYEDGACIIMTAKTLDREDREHYLLNITATDETYMAKTAVELTVLDANDNSPVCEKGLYAGTVPENAPPGKFILLVTASDPDIQENAEITYRLAGDEAESFGMDPVTGTLKTLLPLDREKRDVYNLTVEAVDGGNRSCQVAVVITVEDVNDSPPVFTSDLYYISVFDNTQPGAYVARLQAHDADTGLNSKISYSFEDSAGGLFSIEEPSGIISLVKPLSRQEKPVYRLRARAADHGSPRTLSTLCSVEVIILDANHRPPVFEHRDYVSMVPEDVAVGTLLLTVFAGSSDAQANAQTRYSISKGNEEGAFSIDSRTGNIFVIAPLDYEVAQEHYLTVKASAGGQEALSDTATVTIHLTDVNDNSPVFSQELYSTVVSEDTQPGCSVLTSFRAIQVTAKDFDGPSNSRIHYSIVGGNQDSPYIMDAVSGVLKVARQLDREKVGGYELTVLASDSGNPPKSSSAAINVTVADVNDNPPVFSQGNYSLIIQESLPAGASVLQLSVTDRDSPQNGPPFSYIILKGNEGKPFSVDQRGVIRTTATLKSSEKDQYVLRVQVSDSGKPPLQSSALLNIHVAPTSKHPPAVLPQEVFILVPEEEYPAGGILGRVHATDPDEYDTLTYTLQPPGHDLISVSDSDGRLMARRGLDMGRYPLNVSVSDGHFSSSASVTVHVRQVTQQMLDGSVSIRFASVTAEDFVREHWRNFQRAIRSVVGIHSRAGLYTRQRRDVQILSLQPVEPDGDLDVLMFLERSGGAGSSLDFLLKNLNTSSAALQELSGLRILRVMTHECSDAKCPGHMCRQVATLDSSSMAVYSTDRVSYVTARHHMTTRCLCKDGKCLEQIQGCASKPCPEGYRCVSLQGENKYHCICPWGKSEKCLGRALMTFSENSYIKYHLRKSSSAEMKFSLRLRTFSSHGTVMFIKGRGYSLLKVVGGRLQCQFDCGSGQATMSVHSIEVNDGQWHSVELEVKGNRAKLVLDSLHSASGILPGVQPCLGLDKQVILGGHTGLLGPRPRRSLPLSASLQGCMDTVLFNGQSLFLHSESLSGVVVEDIVGVTPGCGMSSTPGQDCTSNPCLNGGSCSQRPNGGYYCRCNSLFVGAHCELSINPCVSNPCLYGGTCIQNNDNYYCRCRGQYTGQRCQTDVDECLQPPCLNGGWCVNIFGTFNCSCSPGFSGRLCEMENEVHNVFISSSWSIGLAELVGILIFLVAIFILALLFVLIRTGFCKPSKDEQEKEKYRAVDAYIQRTYLDCQPRRDTFLDTPPLVPVKPLCYNPSIPADSHKDTDRSSMPEFSSFTPDVLFGFKKSVAVCSVAPNLPQRQASQSPTNSDSGRKPGCGEEDENARGTSSALPKEEEGTDSQRGSTQGLAYSFQFPDDNNYHWDTSDWMHGVQISGFQSLLQYEFVQMPSAYPDINDVYPRTYVSDLDYLAEGDDVESNFLTPAEHFLHDEPPSNLEYRDKSARTLPHTTIARTPEPCLTSRRQQQHSLDNSPSNQTAQEVPQCSIQAPFELRPGSIYSGNARQESSFPNVLHTSPQLSATGEELDPMVCDYKSLDEDVPSDSSTPMI
ncbi:hypothetical protein NFI96_024623, partial [Prochilodus magdalenae]